MTETDAEEFIRLMLHEFGRVHERFDRLEQRFGWIDTRLTNIESELAAIHQQMEPFRLREGI